MAGSPLRIMILSGEDKPSKKHSFFDKGGGILLVSYEGLRYAHRPHVYPLYLLYSPALYKLAFVLVLVSSIDVERVSVLVLNRSVSVMIMMMIR